MSTYHSLFIALRPEPSPALTTALTDIRAQLAAASPQISVTSPTNDHITLAFLGKLPLDQAIAHLERCTQALQGLQPFTITLDRLDTFSGRFPAGVLFATPRSDARLDRVRDAYRELADREQVLHWTLARARSQEASDTLAGMTGPRVLGEAHVHAVHLMANDGSNAYASPHSITLK